ncbi:hypothetical protein QBC37DRAFT_51479 [Rhypophila decipiens]|uniref:Uncharacterized protein n=1 Tax=Rhypophila decipiens TaxID=261697 RepID=A0AAN7B642_9PEZI|nr:hypothetical protein QBC37DRAFT_51479 [Rhypophila decipiens]
MALYWDRHILSSCPLRLGQMGPGSSARTKLLITTIDKSQETWVVSWLDRAFRSSLSGEAKTSPFPRTRSLYPAGHCSLHHGRMKKTRQRHITLVNRLFIILPRIQGFPECGNGGPTSSSFGQQEFSLGSGRMGNLDGHGPGQQHGDDHIGMLVRDIIWGAERRRRQESWLCWLCWYPSSSWPLIRGHLSGRAWAAACRPTPDTGGQRK